MHKTAVLLMCAVLWSCSSKPQNVAAKGDNKPGPAMETKKAELFPVRVKGKYGYIDKTGKMVIQPTYAGAQRFSDGLAAVQLQPPPAGKVGYIDETGKMVIPPQFETADPFSEGRAPVMN